MRVYRVCGGCLFCDVFSLAPHHPPQMKGRPPLLPPVLWWWWSPTRTAPHSPAACSLLEPPAHCHTSASSLNQEPLLVISSLAQENLQPLAAGWVRKGLSKRI